MTLSGKWKMVKYYNLGEGDVKSEPSNLQHSVILTFQDDGSSGTVEGQTVVNNVGGSYEIHSDGTMKMLGFGGTKVAGPEWEDIAWDAMIYANAYDIKGNRMFIYFNEGKEKVEFEPM